MSRTITLSRPCRRFVHHKNLVHEIIRPQLLRFTAPVSEMTYTASIGTLTVKLYYRLPYHTSVVCTVILVVCVLLGNWLDDARSW